MFKNTKKTTLLQAAACGGESSLCAKLMQEWVTGEKIQDIMSCSQSNLHLQNTHSVEAADQVLCSKWLQSAVG